VPFFVALALGSASLGYFLGRGAVPSATPAAVDYKHANEPASENPRVNEDRGDSDESDAEADGDLDRIQPEPAEECKLVRSSATSVLPEVLSLVDIWRFLWYEATLTCRQEKSRRSECLVLESRSASRAQDSL
jgi:hypothetical protein